jgi:glycosyltransferase involved in cell wall biosynthesis
MSKPLRVLHVLGELKISGAETMLVSAASAFQAHGVEAAVLSTGAQEGVYADNFRAAGYTVLHLPFHRSLLFFLAEYRLMKKGNYGVIHLHTEQANFWHGLVALAARPEVVLRTVHNCFAFNGGLRWRRGLQRRLLSRMGLQYVAISDSVRRNESARYRIRCHLISNWYDSERFTVSSETDKVDARDRLGIDQNAFVITSVGNCSKVKNHSAILDAVARLPDATRPLYLHAGAGETEMPERSRADELGIAQETRFLGGVNDVLPILRATDAFVMPSLHEGFGIAALEALGTGLPALLSDVDGLRDFRDDFPGLVYTDTSGEEVLHGLERLLKLSRMQRQEIRVLYAQRAHERFGIERGVRGYLSVYRGSSVEKPTMFS